MWYQELRILEVIMRTSYIAMWILFIVGLHILLSQETLPKPR